MTSVAIVSVRVKMPTCRRKGGLKQVWHQLWTSKAVVVCARTAAMPVRD